MQQRTPEWLELRRTKIGSSDAPIIMGSSPWKTPRQLYEEKISGETSHPSVAMQRGIEMEAEALAKFEQMTGICMSPAVIINKQREWQMASLDGICLNGETIVEIKCGSQKTHQMALEGQIPSYYECQIQHQMSVVGIDEAFYFSFDGKNGAIVEIKRDEEFIEKLLIKECEFWHGMRDQIPPPLTEKDFKEINSIEWDLLAQEYISLLGVEGRKEEIRKRFIELSKDTNCCGSGVWLQKKKRKGLVDYSSVPELFGVDVDSYRKKPIEYWEISIK